MKLVFLHGRAQEDKDPLVLRQTWIVALRQGLAAAGRDLPIDERDIVFPYYGDALRDITSDASDDLATVRFPLREHEERFACEVLQQCLEEAGVTDEAIAAHSAGPVRDDTLAYRLSTSLSSEWIHRGLSLLDRYVPRASAKSMESTAADVTQYLHNREVQEHIESGVVRAFEECEADETIVVGHSLGSIIAYRMLREGGPIKCPVKALITLGSPLGINVVRNTLEPIAYPPAVGSWFNAYDERDVIALNPLDARHFGVDPAITNFSGVQNESDNHHKIRGYLSDRVIATRIVEELRSGRRN